MSRRNPNLDAALGELEACGCAVQSIEHTGRSHIRVTFALAAAPERTRFLIVAGTTSDRHARLHARREARRQAGVLLSLLSPDEARAYHRRSRPKREAPATLRPPAPRTDERRAIPMTSPRER